VAFSSTATMSVIPTYDFTAVVDADVVLQPSDSEQGLRAHRNVLSIASPVFADMFMLPQGENAAALTEGVSPPAEVKLSESRWVIEAVLCFIYPVPNPTVSSLEDLVSLLDAARKFDIVVVTTELGKLLVSPELLKPESSLRIYAISDRFNLEDARQAASRVTLDIDLGDALLLDDLYNMTGHAYHRLLVLHRQRARRASAVVKDNKMPAIGNCSIYNPNGGYRECATTWWSDYLRRAETELSTSSTASVFTVEFLRKSAGCSTCQLATLPNICIMKAKVDALPCTV
jgi:hypothetical protein